METNDSISNKNIEEFVKIVNLAEETILVVKFQQQVPEGTKIKEIKVILDTPGGGSGCLLDANL